MNKKGSIFFNHRTYYDSINEELKQWLGKNWTTWIDDQPEWFTQSWQAMAPEDMIPKVELKELLKRRNRESLRRKSVGSVETK